MLRRFFPCLVLALLALSAPISPARANPDLDGEEARVRASVARLAQAVQNRDLSAWGLLRLDTDGVLKPGEPRNIDLRNIQATIQVERVGLSSDAGKALARYALTVWGSSGTQSRLLKRGLQDMALSRAEGDWRPLGAAWDVPDPTLDALSELAATAQGQWAALHDESAIQATPVGAGEVRPISGGRNDQILHLVAERRGGRWIALRRSQWSGRVLSPQALAAREAQAGASNSAPNAGPNGAAQNGAAQWIAGQLGRWARGADSRGGGTLHLLLQSGRRDWVGLDGVWEPRLSDATPRAPRFQDAHRNRRAANAPDEGEAAPLSEEAASQAPPLRAEISNDPALFGDSASHRRLAQVLEGAGLFGEAADEWEKAATLVPLLAPPGANVSAARLAAARKRRELDPRARAASQLRAERNVGLDSQHPTHIIDLLKTERQNKGITPLLSLRLGLEYSKLGDDRTAVGYLEDAKEMARKGARLSPDDAAWADVLAEHLEQRRLLLPVKPPNLISTDLFTVRCRLDDAAVLPLLAALEAAQHTVYADFKIPMGATEVVLWPTQSAFQSYTTRFSQQGSSEFVAALTLTKLIATEGGPLVLGEEVNVFVDERLAGATFGTVAHEYGHVAVRQMSRGRTVPVWFNEGLATVVEGGYEGAIERVRTAARGRRLLSMDALRAWNVDGERAFLAYSQANSLVDFMIATWGTERVLEVLRRIGSDVPAETAFANVLGVSTSQLWQRWARDGIR